MPKRDDITVGFLGLHTDPSPLNIPPGALRDAKNVWIRRPGIIEPRPGFEPAGAVASVKLRRYYIDRSGFQVNIREHDSNTNEFTAGEAHVTQAGPARYLTSDVGVARITSTFAAYDTSGLTFAGMPKGLEGFADPTGDTADTVWLADNHAVAYRVVLARNVGSDPQQLIFGEPSGRILFRNFLAVATVAPILTFPLHDDSAEGDLLQIYRSAKVTPYSSDPADEMYLRHTIELSNSDVSNGYVTWTDRLDDDEWQGAALYTNETQEGILRANARTPRCTDVAEYNSMLFCARARSPHRAVLQIHNIQKPSEEGDWFGTVVSSTVSMSAGTTYTVSTAQAKLLKVGMYVQDAGAGNADKNPVDNAGTYIPASAKITAIDTGTGQVTIDKTISGSGTTDLLHRDWISIGGTEYFAGGVQASGTDTTERTFDITVISGILPVRDGIQRLAHIINYQAGEPTYATVFGTSDDEEITLVLERRDFADTSFAVQTSAPLAISCDLGELSATVDLDSEASGGDNVLRWSKLNQPDHCPEVYQAAIGSKTAKILRLAKTRTSLLVWKEDGVWRLTGDSPEAIRIDEYDPELVLWHPDALDTLSNAVYAWTNRGIVRATDGGVEVISTPISSDLDTYADALDTDRQSGTYYWGCFIWCDRYSETVYVGLPSSSADDEIARIYVYPEATRAWSYWIPNADQNWSHMVSTGYGESYGIGWDTNGGTTFQQAEIAFSEANFDQIISAGSNSVDAVGAYDSATQTQPGIEIDHTGWTPVAGDAFNANGVLAVVRSVEDAGDPATVTARAPSALSTDALVPIYVGYDCVIKPRIYIEGNPGALKQWRQIVLEFLDTYHLDKVVVDFTSDLETTEASISLAGKYRESNTGQVFRGSVPREVARSAVLEPEINIRAATSTWQLGAMSLTYRATGRRVGK